MIPDTTQREVDVAQEVFVFWKNRILRPGVFIGLYAMEASRFEVLGFSGSFLSEEKDVEALKESFVSWLASDLQSIPSYEHLVRADPRNVNVPNREGVERAKGKGKGSWRTAARPTRENAPYVRNRNARSWRDLDDDAGTIPGWYQADWTWRCDNYGAEWWRQGQ